MNSFNTFFFVSNDHIGNPPELRMICYGWYILYSLHDQIMDEIIDKHLQKLKELFKGENSSITSGLYNLNEAFSNGARMRHCNNQPTFTLRAMFEVITF